jgi:hypothetical protein
MMQLADKRLWAANSRKFAPALDVLPRRVSVLGWHLVQPAGPSERNNKCHRILHRSRHTGAVAYTPPENTHRPDRLSAQLTNRTPAAERSQRALSQTSIEPLYDRAVD